MTSQTRVIWYSVFVAGVLYLLGVGLLYLIGR
jgi:hypothetical protein